MTKYTLVPVGAVVVVIGMTVGVMQWASTRNGDIIRMRSRVELVEQRMGRMESSAEGINGKLDGQQETLAKMSQSLTLIKYRLGIVEESGGIHRPGNVDLDRWLREHPPNLNPDGDRP